MLPSERAAATRHPRRAAHLPALQIVCPPNAGGRISENKKAPETGVSGALEYAVVVRELPRRVSVSRFVTAGGDPWIKHGREPRRGFGDVQFGMSLCSLHSTHSAQIRRHARRRRGNL